MPLVLPALDTVVLALPQAASDRASRAVTSTTRDRIGLILAVAPTKAAHARWGRITLRGAGDPAQPRRGPGFCRRCGAAAARGGGSTARTQPPADPGAEAS